MQVREKQTSASPGATEAGQRLSATADLVAAACQVPPWSASHTYEGDESADSAFGCSRTERTKASGAARSRLAQVGSATMLKPASRQRIACSAPPQNMPAMIPRLRHAERTC